MNKQLMIVGAMTAARIFGDAVGRAVRKHIYTIVLLFLTVSLIWVSLDLKAIIDENKALTAENSYLKQHCMVFGEPGDIIVPIEALEGDYNWTIR